MDKQFTRIILHLKDPEMSWLKIAAQKEGRSMRNQVMHLIREDVRQRAKEVLEQGKNDEKNTHRANH